MTRDRRTLDIFDDWTPPQLVERFDDGRVRSATLRSRIARAVAEVLRDCEVPRDEVAARMSAWLGEEEAVSKNMLDAYASKARTEATIPFLRLLALTHVTGDTRLLQLGAELFGRSVIEDRFLSWVEVGQLADKKEEFDRAFDAAKRAARKGLRP